MLAAVAGPSAEPLVVGIDHIPIVVVDLEAAEADFTAMGFALKPGRPHENGLRNAHVKFPDGTELELITAPAPTDALATEYFEHAKGGDGPVYFGLYAPDLAQLADALAKQRIPIEEEGAMIGFSASHPLHRLFFSRRQKSPTDRPEHFAHPNTATTLIAVWLARGDPERRLLAGLQTAASQPRSCSPFGPGATAAMLPEGELVFVTPATRPPPARAILAATVRVRSIAAARAVLNRNRVRYRRLACAAGSIWIAPAQVHGLWLELRQ